MAKAIRLVVFDMAGTTVDEQNIVYATLHQILVVAGYHFTLQEVLDEGAGKAKLQAIVDLLQSKYPEAIHHADTLHKQFLATLDANYRTAPIAPQPGAEALFAALHERGIRVALNTGYNRATADALLERLGWKNSPLIAAVVTNDEVERGRPNPDMIFYLMKKLGVAQPEEVAKVGDAAIDIAEGRHAGCGLVVGITTGAHTRQQLAAEHPNAVIDHLTELLEWIDK